MTHVSLFTGIGGFDLACDWLGIETVLQCEIDPYCLKVLEKHWPNVRRIHNVREVNAMAYRSCLRVEGERAEQQTTGIVQQSERPFILTGGFPCQPFSCAGKRKGKADDRFLWPEMLRVVSELRPRWVLGENVAGIVNMALDDCLASLEGVGYTAWPIVVPACAVNAPHRRDRVWIVAHAEGRTERAGLCTGEPGGERGRRLGNASGQDAADAVQRAGQSGEPRSSQWSAPRTDGGAGDWWAVEPNVGRVATGIPARVDRLKCLGNAIVPQVAYEIIKMMVAAV